MSSYHSTRNESLFARLKHFSLLDLNTHHIPTQYAQLASVRQAYTLQNDAVKLIQNEPVSTKIRRICLCSPGLYTPD